MALSQEFRVVDDDNYHHDITLSTPKDETTHQRFISLTQDGSVVELGLGMLPDLIEALKSLQQQSLN